MKVLATGLKFPEGPVAMADGSVIFVEMAGGTLRRAWPDGRSEIVADLGGGPNGAAMGPDGRIYVANNGGHDWIQTQNPPIATGKLPPDYVSGRIEAVDINTGAIEMLYDRCGEHMLRGPNDILFDKHGDIWFTDFGRAELRRMDRGGVYWAKADGSEIREVIYPLHMPNGLAISGDGKTLYVDETMTSRVWSWEITGPGAVRKLSSTPHGGHFIWGASTFQRFDGMAIAASGNVLVGTLNNGGVTEITADGMGFKHHYIGDPEVTNLCFGGADMKTIYLTLAHSGQLVAMDWHEAGLALPFQDGKS